MRCQSSFFFLFFFLLVTFPGFTVTTDLTHFNHRFKILRTVFKNLIFHIKAFERPLMLQAFKVYMQHYRASKNKTNVYRKLINSKEILTLKIIFKK